MSNETVTIEKGLYDRLTFQLASIVNDALTPAVEEMVKMGELESARVYCLAALQLIELIRDLLKAKVRQDTEDEKEGLPF